ncbi:TPA: penicillin-binding protein [Candidatus Collierbacteria bacterium]|nr:penicillin-binding protein [Candidatus Collierbacteria bacterium]
MVTKNEAKSNNFLAALGRPVFKLLIFLISLAGFILFFFENRATSLRTKLALYQPKSDLLFRMVPSFSNIRLHFLKQLKLPPNRYLLFLFSVIGLTTFIYIEIFRELPDPNQLSQFPSKLTTQILDRNGVLLYKIYKDENRTLVSLDSLPPHVKNAFLSAEDKDFYFHKGFSLPGLFRAFYKNIFDDRMEGGSTITQQLIKNTLLTSEKTIIRKTKEIILSIKTERLFSKDKIFEMYLNQVGFGGPAYGIQEAARQYFDIDAKDLDLAQTAYIAGLTRAPSKYSPFGDQPDMAIDRQQWVLGQMYRNGQISKTDLDQSLEEKLDFRSAKIEIKAPHFVMLVKRLLIDQLGENVVTQGGLKVYTTLNSNLQDQVQKIVTEEIEKLKPLNVGNGSALIANPKTGEVLSMVGSKDYFNLKENGQVNLTMALRQPGSSIKPLNYALFFENGNGPATVIEDKPITIYLPGQEAWTPKNYDGKFHGSITLRQALASSYNIPSVLLLTQNGPSNFASFAKKLGITTWEDSSRYGLSMALGSLEVRMVDLATAYSAFANQGISTPLNTILSVEKPDGKKIRLSICSSGKNKITEVTGVNAEDSRCNSKKAISPTTAYLISDILSDNTARSPAFGTNSVLNIKSAKVSVKTGTSNDLKDNWTIGYTSNFLVATWVGNNDNTPMSQIASGITGASPIWAKIFNLILETNHEPKSLTPPENLIKVPICILTGTLTCTGCPTRTDYFIKGTEPKTACDPADIERRLHPTPSPVNAP